MFLAKPSFKTIKQGDDFMKNSKVRMCVDNAIIAALYCALTLTPGLNALSYNAIQFRLAEILLFLVFYKKQLGFGIVLGCLISNCFSPLGLPDIIFGTLSSAIAVVLIAFLGKKLEIVAFLPLIQCFIIAGELTIVLKELPYWTNFLYVLLGELAVMIVGYIVFKIIGQKKWFEKCIK